MIYNTSSQPFCFADSYHGRGRVILPHSSRVLTEVDVHSEIEKTRNAITDLSGALSIRKTHGGKSFRARQMGLKNQVELCSKRLDLLLTAAQKIAKINNSIQTKIDQHPQLNQQLNKVTSAACSVLGLNIPPARYYPGQSSFTNFFGDTRKITVIHAAYLS